jgi:GT2 family glycosyltransferase
MSCQLSIVIVNWNCLSLLPRCLESIATWRPSVPFEVIIVDNASTDGSLEWLRSPEARSGFADGQLRLIENASNVGFGRANNQAIALSRSELVFLLNPDTEVRQGAIDALITLLRDDHRIGACAPRLLNPDGSLQPSVWRATPSAFFTLLEGFKLSRLIPQPLRGELLLSHHWPHARRRMVKSFSGAAFMVRRQVIDEVGPFSDKVDMYGEEGDLFGRIRDAGWKLAFEPIAEVVHVGGQSSKQRWDDREQRMIQYEGYLRMHMDCLPAWKAVLNILAHTVTMKVMRLRRLLKGQCTRGLDESLKLNAYYIGRILRGSTK